jgi:putative membrane protein
MNEVAMFYKIAPVAAIAVLLSAGTAWAKTDAEFITDAIIGSNSEIALGKLAKQMGSTKAVRNFGQTLIADHGKARKSALALAPKLGVQPSSELKPAAQQELDKLKALSGPAFDQEFASYMVDDHQKDIAEFQEEAGMTASPATAFAKKTLPTLQKHLELAQAIAK